MATSQVRLCVLFRHGASLLTRKVNGVAPVAVEGQRQLTTKPKYKAPYPYQTKKFNYFSSLIDFTTSRFNENTRLIVVDGLPCVGKSEFAKKLAAHFQLNFIPNTSENEMYSVNGFDIRQLNDAFENPKLKFHDLRSFYMNPGVVKENGALTTMEIRMMVERYYEYIAALRHILSTGQGVVLENNIWSEENYANCLYNMGYIPKKLFHHYSEYRKNVTLGLWRPHLIIYLDAPSEWILEQMMKKHPEYKGSPVLTKAYIDQLKAQYEKTYLPFNRLFSEVLRYDVTNMEEFELIALDLENLDLMSVSYEDESKYVDWRRSKEEEFSVYRLNLFNEDAVDRAISWRPAWHLPEVYISGAEYDVFKSVWEKVPELNTTRLGKFDSDEHNPFALAKGSYLDPRAN